MAASDNLRVLFDWDRDGDFTGPFDDVSARARGGIAGRLDVEAGRDLDAVAPQIIIASGSVTLSNADKVLNRRNASSPLTGKVLPARPVQIERRVGATAPGVGGTLHTLFRGRTDDQAVRPDPAAQSVTFRLADTVSDLRGRKTTVNLGVQQGIRTGAALDLLLTDIGYSGARDLDPGVTVMPIWWEEGQDAFEAIGRLLTSEGPPAFCIIDGDGTFVFRDRHHRLLDAVSNTSQSTWRASGSAEPILGKDFEEYDAWQSIVNDVAVPIDVRRVEGMQVVWSSDDEYVIGPDAVFSLPIDATDPFVEPQPLVPGVDYQLVAGDVLADDLLVDPIGSQIGPSTTLTTVGGAAGSTITNLRLRARPIRTVTAITVRAKDTGSQDAFGVRSLPASDGIGPWCSVLDAQAIADQIVYDRSTPLGRAIAPIQVGRLAGGRPSPSIDRANGVLGRDISHRVTLVVPDASIAGAYYVEGIRHDVAGEEDHLVTTTLEEVPNGGLANRDFEQGIAGWSAVNGTLVWDRNVTHSGSGAAAFTTNAATSPGIESVKIPTGEGQLVTASAWLRASVSTQAVALSILWYDASGALLSASTIFSANLAAANTWQRVYSLVAPPPAPVDAAFFTLKAEYGGVTVAGRQLWLDDVSLYTPPPGDVFRFDTAGQGFDVGRFGR